LVNEKKEEEEAKKVDAERIKVSALIDQVE
jgi:hypothetical protein